MRLNRVLPLVVVLLAACVTLTPGEVHGCGGAFRPGERVDVADETALIVWDEASKTEHFIRQATFVGSGYDFGFLVPTPSRPQLEPADPDLFTELVKITEPKTEIRHESGGLTVGCGGAALSKKSVEGAAVPAGFVVLEQKRVGDLDAAVLGFRDGAGHTPEEAAFEVLGWLTRNQYAVRPELAEWIAQYARDKWVITAFKIAGEPPTGGATGPAPGTTGRGDSGAPKGTALKASAVRMSFKTDRPFFPYREPADQRDARAQEVKRLLRVYVAAKQRMAGKIGNATAWPGTTVWANAITAPERDGALGKAKLPTATAPDAWYLTEFEDRSTPRPGTDEVYFEPSPDQSPVARRPNIEVVYDDPWWAPIVCCGVPLGLLIGVLFCTAPLIRWVLRRVRTAPPAA